MDCQSWLYKASHQPIYDNLLNLFEQLHDKSDVETKIKITSLRQKMQEYDFLFGKLLFCSLDWSKVVHGLPWLKCPWFIVRRDRIRRQIQYYKCPVIPWLFYGTDAGWEIVQNTNNLSRSIQSPSLSASDAHAQAREVIKILTAMRIDKEEAEFKTEVDSAKDGIGKYLTSVFA